MKRKNTELIINALIDPSMPIASKGLSKKEAVVQKTILSKMLGPLYSQFLKAPELSPEQLEQIKVEIPIELRGVLKELARTLPHSPGGRPRKLTTEESRKSGQIIDDLVYKGVDRSIALRQVANKKGVSLRTVQRAYGNYRAWKLSPKLGRKR
jgi:hypothetical protein